MNFSSFLQKAKNPEFWNENKIISFVGEEYQPLFFSALFTALINNNSLPRRYQRISFHKNRPNEMHACLFCSQCVQFP